MKRCIYLIYKLSKNYPPQKKNTSFPKRFLSEGFQPGSLWVVDRLDHLDASRGHALELFTTTRDASLSGHETCMLLLSGTTGLGGKPISCWLDGGRSGNVWCCGWMGSRIWCFFAVFFFGWVSVVKIMIIFVVCMFFVYSCINMYVDWMYICVLRICSCISMYIDLYYVYLCIYKYLS